MNLKILKNYNTKKCQPPGPKLETFLFSFFQTPEAEAINFEFDFKLQTKKTIDFVIF